MTSRLMIAAWAALLAGTAVHAEERDRTTAPTLVDRMSIEVARDHQLHGRLDDAETQLAPLTKRRALGAEGQQLLGEIAAERGQWQQAEVHYRAALAHAPDQAGLYLRLGQALQALKREADADLAYGRYRALRAAEKQP